MKIDHPESSQIPELRQLWQEAFGDSDAFLDAFFLHAYDPNRCLCCTENGAVIAALYWLDGQYSNQPVAYIYAVATAKAHRGKGCCHNLMDTLPRRLRENGYAAAILVPGDDSLKKLYFGMGYRFFGGMSALPCLHGDAVSLRAVDAEEYGRLRLQYLPERSVIQQGASLRFLQSYAELYAGADFLTAVYREESALAGLELLGNAQAAPGILAALGAQQGSFRIPGNEDFAMWLPFVPLEPPAYFGLAFD